MSAKTKIWPTFVLSDLIEKPFSGFWGADTRGGGYSIPVRAIRLADASQNAMLDGEKLQVRWFSRREAELARCYPGDLILVASGMETGSVSSAPGKNSRELVVVTNFLRRLRPRRGVNSRWLYHVLTHPCVKSIALVNSGQTSVRNLSGSFYRNLKVPTPPLGEQRRIAEILDALDNSIQSEELVISKVQRQREGLLVQLVNNGDISPSVRMPGSLPKRVAPGWLSIRLGETGVWLSGGTPSTTDPRYWGGGIPWISAASLKNFYINDSERRITHLGARSGTQLVPAGTVLFVVRGMSLKSELRIGVTQRDVAFGQDCKAIVPMPEINGVFLATAIKARANQILGMVDEAGHGTGRLPTDLISSLEIGVPSMLEQLRITNILEGYDQAIDQMRRELAKLRLLKRGLMDDLLTGRVRVPAGDEVSG